MHKGASPQSVTDTIPNRSHQTPTKSEEPAIHAITAVLSATPEVAAAPWWSDTWITDTVRKAPRRFHGAVEPSP